ncbi:MAG TPA: hypothetical protein VHK69_21485 [Chitinophagaceae bacterium]|jgi:hypothetical protein|nr:hypothetical protein [Chitinophagaceae bacterium]
MKNNWLFLVTAAFLLSCGNQVSNQASGDKDTTAPAGTGKETAAAAASAPKLDTAHYNRMLRHMANGDTSGRWPVKHEYPLPGAILPFKRIVAYYGNLYSKQMGALGEFPKDDMLRRLQGEVDKWTKADSLMPAIPALHYIAITAQLTPGKGGKYRLRMPFSQIDTVISWAKEINALVFIDIQVGLSTLQQELPEFEKYLSMPNVHFGIDPEFSMKGGDRPGTRVGTFDAADINYTTEYLAGLVRKHNLPPKILIVHRFTQKMVTGYKDIKLRPEVQVVMDMDGWGEPARKINTYRQFIYPEPVQFTGFKIFYKNDTKRVNQPKEMQPEQLLGLKPVPVYIQYQ